MATTDQTTISYEVVAKACDELAKAGVKPTQRSIIDKVGRGSFSTVGPHLRAWKAARDAAAASATGADAPRHIEIEAAVAAVLRRAQNEVREELQSDLDDQAREISQLTAERDADRAKSADLAKTVEELRAQASELKGQLEATRGELESTRRERNDATHALEELRGVHGQLVEAKASLDARVVELQDTALRQSETLRQLEQRTTAAVTGQAAAEQALATTKAELEATLAVERKARAEAEHRVLAQSATIDGYTEKLQSLAAAQSAEKELRSQVATLTSMLQAAEQRAERVAAAAVAGAHAVAPAAEPASTSTKGGGAKR